MAFFCKYKAILSERINKYSDKKRLWCLASVSQHPAADL